MLDELDQELERRGHRFVRYADDSNIYVRSERAGQRVMESISRFITEKLKLRQRKGYRREARSEGSVEQTCESMDKNRVQGAQADVGKWGKEGSRPF